MLLQKMTPLTGLVLTAGDWVQEFGEFANLVSAAVSFTEPFTTNVAYGVSWAISGNRLTVTVKTQPLNAPGAWANPGSVTVTSLVLTMLVDGE
jgi:hypothetical protein